MASTRRINNPADYQIEKLSNQKNVDYLTTKEYGAAKGTYYPGQGLLQGKLGMESISNNQIDIFSSEYIQAIKFRRYWLNKKCYRSFRKFGRINGYQAHSFDLL